jgi:hypothetical protein
MPPSSPLCRLVSRAVTVFAASSTTAAAAQSFNAEDFSALVSCTRALVLLAESTGKSVEDAHLLHGLHQCAERTLDALRALPSSEEVQPDVLVTLFGILRSSAGFWESERSEQLAQQLSERVDAVVLRTWRPRVLLAAVHAIAKACPSQSSLAFLDDALPLLRHHEAQLSERDVATLLWSMAVLHVADGAQAQMWSSLCRRAALLFARMNVVSRQTISQALLLQHRCVCESQVELLRVVYKANRELERYAADADPSYSSGKAQRKLLLKRHAAHLYAGGNAGNGSPNNDASQLTAQLLQYTTHTLSDEALVHLALTLFASDAEATEELLLVLAHLSRRTTLAERLCVQVLRFAQAYARAREASVDADALSSANTSVQSSSSLHRVYKSVQQTRQHVTQLLVRAVGHDQSRVPREAVEVLCVEHCCLRRSGRGQPSSGSVASARVREGAGVDAATDAVWAAIMAVLAGACGKGSTALHSLDGLELWSWQCIRVYVQSVQGSAVGATTPLASSPALAGEKCVLERLNICGDVQRCWPNPRERQACCAEVVVAAAQSSGTQLLVHAGAPRCADALQLLTACRQEVCEGVDRLPVMTILRLLSAIDEAPAVVAPVIHTLRSPLLACLGTHASCSSGALPAMVQYLSNALARRRNALAALSSYSGSNNSSASALSTAPRVSDAVLDVYVRLLVQEQQLILPTVQADLLVECLQERQRRPAALESAFMILMTRRLGQPAALFEVTTLPLQAMSGLVELASWLPREQGDTAATATRAIILTTLLDVLTERCIPACTSADGLVTAGMLLRLDAVWEFKRAQALATALEKRGTTLLSSGSGGASWSSTQKAYLIAALVCAQKEPSEALLRALNPDDRVADSNPPH